MGMINWNPPKNMAMMDACLTSIFWLNPRVIEILKASMASPIDKKIIEIISILKPIFYMMEYKN